MFRQKDRGVPTVNDGARPLDVETPAPWQPPGPAVVVMKGGGVYYIVKTFDEVMAMFREATDKDGKFPTMIEFDVADGQHEKRIAIFTKHLSAVIDLTKEDAS